MKKINFTAIRLFLKNVDIEKILVSNKISFGEENYKYSIGYLYNDNKVKPLHIMLPKIADVKSYDGQTKWMYFSMEDDDLLEKYNTNWDKVSADISACLKNQKKNFPVMKLQIFTLKKFLR